MSDLLDITIHSTRRLVARARIRLFWETYAPTFAPATVAIGAFSIGAGLGVWQWIGDPVRLIALAVTLYFVVRSILRALKLRIPSYSDARRRVETDSGQAHRPLDVLDDRPALSADVWPAHQKAALRQAEGLKAATRRPTVSKIDTYYLRFAIPALLLGVGVYMAGFTFERLRTAVTPTWQSSIRSSQITYEAWIDPPAYTGRPPIYFKDGADIAVPAGSEFVARLSGVKNAPRPRLVQGWRSKFLTPKRIGAKSFEIRETIDDTSDIQFRVGLSRRGFALNVGPDSPPSVEVLDEIKVDKRDRLTLAYGLIDDFGVETLELEMSLMRDDTDLDTAFDDISVRADIPLPGSRQTKVERAKAALDLSKTRYAGQKVIGRLVATDGSGQTGVSDPVWFTVPDKIFVEPLAKAVAEQRTLVMAGLDDAYAPLPTPEWIPSDGDRTENLAPWNEYQPRQHWNRSPADIQRATLLIEAITDEPAGLFKDPAVFMGLRHARSQMRHAESLDDLRGLPENLWKIALRAEFGILGTTLEEMREAEAALREGIARRASKREVDTLFERYNLAVDAYTEELRRKAQEEGTDDEGGGGGGSPPMGSMDEIQALMKAIEEANAAGDTEGARIALEQLSELLENMKIQLSKGGGGGGGGDPSGGDMSEEEQKQLEDLADLTGKQRDLQDETDRAEREDDEAEGELDPQELAKRQSQLRDLLENFGDTLPAQGDTAGDQSGETGENQSGEGQTSGDTGEGQTPGYTGQGDAPGDSGEGQGQSQGQSQEQGQSGGEAGDGEGQGREPGGTETAPSAGSDQDSTLGTGQSGGGSADTQTGLAEGLGAAQDAMRRSEEALAKGNLAEAGKAQDEAIQALRGAGEALAKAVSQNGDGEEGDSNDPLGRSDDGFDNGTSSADIDQRDNATRSRELLEELRRRAAEQQRETEEREYLERLLKRF